MKRNNPFWIIQHKIWHWNLFWYRDFLYWNFNRRLRSAALFIEKHNIFPVNLDQELLDVWKGK